ncbi:hypothetical protein ACSX1A_02900 [Pontibacter sp. MBLB2868]|uniref:hypothetical protein n=1 Tax=Pontibacter sp. MBLB2868 TaxID=3451555 RepID=UPI003F756EC9
MTSKEGNMLYTHPDIRPIQNTGRYLFVILTFVFAFLLIIAEDLYMDILQEDHVVEWCTFFALIAAGVIALKTAITIKKAYGYTHWFFILFFLFSILAGLEEISWGQRIFGWESSGFFARYNDQHETNIHNTVQGVFKVKTKHIALLVVSVYGLLLPLLVSWLKPGAQLLRFGQFLFPPKFLGLGFLLASLMLLDYPTGREEEIGEFFYSLCFLLMTLYFYQLAKLSPAFEQ